MTVMFQEEVSKLRLQIVELSEQKAAGERDRGRLAGLLTNEQQKTQKAEADLVEVQRELTQVKHVLNEKIRVAEHLANVEAQATAAIETAKKLERDKDALSEKLEATETKLKDQHEILGATKAALVEANKQIEPLRSLVAALKMKLEANRVIHEQLDLLNLGSAD